MEPKTLGRMAQAWILASLMGLVASASAQTVVTIDPKSATVPVGYAFTFKSTVTGTTNTAVTWTVNDILGGNATIGTIDATGKYTTPPVPPPGYTVTVKDVSVATPTAYAACSLTIRNQTPLLSSLSPNPMPLGAFKLTVNGSKFVSGAAVLWNGSALPTSFVSSSQVTATGTATTPAGVAVTVANPGPGAVSSPLTLSVTSSVTVTVNPALVSLPTGGTQSFQATVTGSANQAVTWRVNGIAGGSAAVGTISIGGLYTAPPALPPGGIVTVSAVAAADGISQGAASVTVQDPLAITDGRFLDQTTFGPTPALMAHVAQTGFSGFLDEQFLTPESPWPALATATRSTAVDAFWANAQTGADQLRQRVIYALSEILVVAMNKNTNGNEIVPWLQLLSRNAFGNYRTLLKELTLDASMGKYLDLANSGFGGGAPNENYPREVMQLFSIGLVQLNPDGSSKLDGQGQPIPTYTQTDVVQMARALTGWTYGNSSGVPPAWGNYSYYPGPMLAVAAYHNKTAKTILGQSLPASQTAAQDLDGAVNILFGHPNIGPFLATRLIRALVTSNPTPAYIARVAAAFADSGQGVRGDMQAVLRAILLDAEARNDNPPAIFGRLRTPMQHTISLIRALNLNPGPASQWAAWQFCGMDEGILDAPSVFGHYSPLYRIPKTPTFGPEFQIYSASDAINRANFFYSALFSSTWPINPALQPFVNVAGNATTLINAVDNALLFGRMSGKTRTAIANALPAQYDNNARALAALYLTVTSAESLVQR